MKTTEIRNQIYTNGIIGHEGLKTTDKQTQKPKSNKEGNAASATRDKKYVLEDSITTTGEEEDQDGFYLAPDIYQRSRDLLQGDGSLDLATNQGEDGRKMIEDGRKKMEDVGR